MVKAQKDRMVRDMAIMQIAQAYYANNSDKRIKLAQSMKDQFKGDQKALLWIQRIGACRKATWPSSSSPYEHCWSKRIGCMPTQSQQFRLHTCLT